MRFWLLRIGRRIVARDARERKRKDVTLDVPESTLVTSLPRRPPLSHSEFALANLPFKRARHPLRSLSGTDATPLSLAHYPFRVALRKRRPLIGHEQLRQQ